MKTRPKRERLSISLLPVALLPFLAACGHDSLTAVSDAQLVAEPNEAGFQTAFGNPNYQFVNDRGIRLLLICGDEPGVTHNELVELFGRSNDRLRPGSLHVIQGLSEEVCTEVSAPGFSFRDALSRVFE